MSCVCLVYVFDVLRILCMSSDVFVGKVCLVCLVYVLDVLRILRMSSVSL